MNNQKNNPPAGGLRDKEKRMLPFFIEFVKFATGFAAIVAVALFSLHIATATIG